MKIITAVLLSIVLLQIMVSCPQRFPHPRNIGNADLEPQSRITLPQM